MNKHFTFFNPSTGATLIVEADILPQAMLNAQALLSNPQGWNFEGTPIDKWLEQAREMFAPI